MHLVYTITPGMKHLFASFFNTSKQIKIIYNTEENNTI